MIEATGHLLSADSGPSVIDSYLFDWDLLFPCDPAEVSNVDPFDIFSWGSPAPISAALQASQNSDNLFPSRDAHHQAGTPAQHDITSSSDGTPSSDGTSSQSPFPSSAPSTLPSLPSSLHSVDAPFPHDCINLDELSETGGPCAAGPSDPYGARVSRDTLLEQQDLHGTTSDATVLHAQQVPPEHQAAVEGASPDDIRLSAFLQGLKAQVHWPSSTPAEMYLPRHSPNDASSSHQSVPTGLPQSLAIPYTASTHSMGTGGVYNDISSEEVTLDHYFRSLCHHLSPLQSDMQFADTLNIQSTISFQKRGKNKDPQHQWWYQRLKEIVEPYDSGLLSLIDLQTYQKRCHGELVVDIHISLPIIRYETYTIIPQLGEITLLIGTVERNSPVNQAFSAVRVDLKDECVNQLGVKKKYQLVLPCPSLEWQCRVPNKIKHIHPCVLEWKPPHNVPVYSNMMAIIGCEWDPDPIVCTAQNQATARADDPNPDGGTRDNGRRHTAQEKGKQAAGRKRPRNCPSSGNVDNAYICANDQASSDVPSDPYAQFCLACLIELQDPFDDDLPHLEPLGLDRARTVQFGAPVARVLANLHKVFVADVTDDKAQHTTQVEQYCQEFEESVEQSLFGRGTGTFDLPSVDAYLLETFKYLATRCCDQIVKRYFKTLRWTSKDLGNMSSETILCQGDEIRYLLPDNRMLINRLVDPMQTLAQWALSTHPVYDDGYLSRLEGDWLLATYFDAGEYSLEDRAISKERFLRWLQLEYVLDFCWCWKGLKAGRFKDMMVLWAANCLDGAMRLDSHLGFGRVAQYGKPVYDWLRTLQSDREVAFNYKDYPSQSSEGLSDLLGQMRLNDGSLVTRSQAAVRENVDRLRALNAERLEETRVRARMATVQAYSRTQ